MSPRSSLLVILMRLMGTRPKQDLRHTVLSKDKPIVHARIPLENSVALTSISLNKFNLVWVVLNVASGRVPEATPKAYLQLPAQD